MDASRPGRGSDADRRQRRAVGTPLGALALIVWEKKIVLAIMRVLFVNPVTLLQTGSLSTYCELADCCLALCWQRSEALQLWLWMKHPWINENGAHVSRLLHFWISDYRCCCCCFYHCRPPWLNSRLITSDKISMVALSSFGCHKSFVHACTLRLPLLPGLWPWTCDEDDAEVVAEVQGQGWTWRTQTCWMRLCGDVFFSHARNAALIPSWQLLIAMKFGIVIAVPQRIAPPDLGDPFYRTSPAGHHLVLIGTVERSKNLLHSWLFNLWPQHYTDQICCTDMHGPQMTYPSYPGDSVSFYLVAPSAKAKCLDNNWMNYHVTGYRHLWFPEDEPY